MLQTGELKLIDVEFGHGVLRVDRIPLGDPLFQDEYCK